MIHSGIAEDPQRHAVESVGDQIVEGGEIGVLLKEPQAAIGSIEHMIWITADDGACATWYVGEHYAPSRMLSRIDSRPLYFVPNPTTDLGSPPTEATDLYIKSIEIVPAAAPGQPGDYNKDCTVNAADYVVWRDHQGQTFQLDNEVSGVTHGMVTPEDYAEWRARFGNTSASGTGSAVAFAAVPEPDSLACVVIATIGVIAVVAGSRRRPGVPRPLRSRALQRLLTAAAVAVESTG